MMDNSHDTKYDSSTSSESCCPQYGYGPNPDISATRTYCSGRVRTFTSPSKITEKTAASPGDSVFVEGREASPSVGSEKIVWSWSEEGEAKASTNYYTVFSVCLFGDYNFDGAINSVDYAAANNLTEHGWPMLVASNMFHKVELKTDVLIPGYKILSLSGDAQIRVWTTANPTINDTPLLITGQTVTNGFNGASFGASPISMLYVEALDSGVATLTYSYVGTGSAEELGCSASLGMTVVKVEFDQLKVDTRNINQIDTGKYKDYKKCIAVQWVSSKKIDFKEYLKIEPSNLMYDDIKDHISWKKNGSEMESSVLSYDNKPSESEIDDYGINVCSESGSVYDRLIVVVYPEETKAAFDSWYSGSSDMSWLSKLPSVYSSLGENNSDPEPGLFNQKWYANDILSSYYHHEASYEMRSKEVDGGHGHQACYWGNGVLVESGISAGTADYRHYTDIWGSETHVSEDVKPFVWAAQLDGNPVEYAGRDMTYALIRKSAFLNKYFNRRPPHTGTQIPPEE